MEASSARPLILFMRKHRWNRSFVWCLVEAVRLRDAHRLYGWGAAKELPFWLFLWHIRGYDEWHRGNHTDETSLRPHETSLRPPWDHPQKHRSNRRFRWDLLETSLSWYKAIFESRPGPSCRRPNRISFWSPGPHEESLIECLKSAEWALNEFLKFAFFGLLNTILVEMMGLLRRGKKR